jgi:RNA polymerase sigma-70 factor (ECF subfamily)
MVDRARRNGRQGVHEPLVDKFVDAAVAEESTERDSRYGDQYGDPEALREAVRALPMRQRTAIELLKLRELSLKEAAETSGVGTSALKVSVHRAMKKLRGSLA